MKPPFVLALDQGTTSSRAILFDSDLRPVALAQREFTQHFPRPGWVEHDPEDIWESLLAAAREAIAKARARPADIAAIGIANQRETTLLWERASGKPVGRAIVWQDRRAADICRQMRADGFEPAANEKSGLFLDPYFSAGKIAWMLGGDESLARRAANGDLAFGTVDSFLLWRLCGGRIHRTDATNAARTMLFNIRRGEWDDDLLKMFAVPRALLPETLDCAADFGVTDAAIFGAPIRILGVAGDQQAAAIGQACFSPGMLKSTYGTGCFALLNAGETAPQSKNRMLATVAYQFDGRRVYALEGSIFIAGAAVQWLRDGIKIIDDAAQSGALAAAADDSQNVVMVPAFTGLGAPHWDSDARGAIFGLTRASGRAEIARAALESVCLQTRDLLGAMRADLAAAGIDAAPVLRVDGGMSASDWTMQFLADIIDAPVDRPQILETTALGAAYLAGWKSGLYPPPPDFAARWRRQKQFAPRMEESARAAKLAAWRDAVARTLSRPA